MRGLAKVPRPSALKENRAIATGIERGTLPIANDPGESIIPNILKNHPSLDASTYRQVYVPVPLSGWSKGM